MLLGTGEATAPALYQPPAPAPGPFFCKVGQPGPWTKSARWRDVRIGSIASLWKRGASFRSWPITGHSRPGASGPERAKSRLARTTGWLPS